MLSGILEPSPFIDCKRVPNLESITTFKESVNHLVQISPTFQGIPPEFLRSAILKDEILRRQFNKGEVIINEGNLKCDHFFALLSGELVVSKKGEALAKIDETCSFGTIGYFTGKRSADVISAVESAVVLILSRHNIRKWPDMIQSLLHENIARELSRIVESTNNILTGNTHYIEKLENAKKGLLELQI
ncbi:cyclic nucleotide-binding domain-containing protein [Candidatus Gracilibacteria bacterium]|nr:cyclic nucleotide-binding domain-containing protein [Candidatus Gracilibacteria bacterium]PIQ11772.1 MAG: hypothetical protein COW68_01980 [Candidatus Gracilibacteria bacterium CG18_big_fil_WC_8_21_14_2_50_38_16]PIQ42140.1 MAG: hypothetical protein COW06_00765 [Candidatus Gracilibacteria bacterium CG12_big_fil_rev_8_21_14_0_65_38_15]PIZ01406.1 MAG: hypothetical protein COY60_03820 [Candidatus Gracilibacteria bacterium CG_4_10_14_0_8_um_filter_38_28]